MEQFHATEWAVLEMAKDPAMTHKAWIRVMKELQNSSRRKEDQEELKLSPIEAAMAKNLRNQRGIAVQMILKNEELLEATKKEMAATRAAMEAKMKELQEAQVTPAVQSDDVYGNEKGE